MSEHNYRVFVGELVTACIECAQCKARVELGLDDFYKIVQCPSCKKSFVRSQNSDDIRAGNSVAFMDLEGAIHRLQQMKDLFTLSFRLPANGEEHE